MREKEKAKEKDSVFKITVFQIILVLLIVIFVFLLSGSELKTDFQKIMSSTISSEDFSALASKAGKLFDFQKKDDIFEEENKENITEKDEEKVSEENSSVGGKDISPLEVPSNCSYAPLIFTEEIINPIEKGGRYTSFFGYRNNPITRKYSFHTGLDIACDEGTRIRAAFSGTVKKTGIDAVAGKYIYLSHADGLESFYCHCSKILVKQGMKIRRGETIALVGSTGSSTGNHVHFEIRKNNVRFDPLPYLKNEA